MHLLMRYFQIKMALNNHREQICESKLPLTIGIGTRIRKSPYYESDLKYGVTGFTVYKNVFTNRFSGPEKYESLINDVTLVILQLKDK